MRRTTESESNFSPHETLRFPRTLTNAFLTLIAVAAHSRLATDEEHFEQARRLHRVVVPCIHLRSLAVAVEQLAGWTRCDEATTAAVVAFEQRIESTLDAGEDLMCLARLVTFLFPSPDELS
jgi:hypothetical protein